MIVLDTHVLIWAFQDDDKLGAQAKDVLLAELATATVKIPAICPWELAQIDRAGRVPFLGGVADWMRRAIATTGVELAPLEPEIAIDSVLMEWSHKDPADRMIVATARYLNCPLLTADRKILAYADTGHLKAIDARH